MLDPKTAAALKADQPGGILLRPDGVVWEKVQPATVGDQTDHERAA
jgi:hypothetical protein